MCGEVALQGRRGRFAHPPPPFFGGKQNFYGCCCCLFTDSNTLVSFLEIGNTFFFVLGWQLPPPPLLWIAGNLFWGQQTQGQSRAAETPARPLARAIGLAKFYRRVFKPAVFDLRYL